MPYEKPHFPYDFIQETNTTLACHGHDKFIALICSHISDDAVEKLKGITDKRKQFISAVLAILQVKSDDDVLKIFRRSRTDTLSFDEFMRVSEIVALVLEVDCASILFKKNKRESRSEFCMLLCNYLYYVSKADRYQIAYHLNVTPNSVHKYISSFPKGAKKTDEEKQIQEKYELIKEKLSIPEAHA